MTAPIFLTADPDVITADLIAAFESITGRTLYPAQVERLLIDVMSYRETILRQDVQLAAERNLVDYADGAYLDALGAFLGVTRLASIAATVPVRFSIATVSGSDVTVPSGTRVAKGSNDVFFATSAVTKIPAGSLYVDATATAMTAGAVGNGYVAGQIATMIDLVAGVSVANTSASAGGYDSETDELLRTRIKLAGAKFGTAGSAQAYRYWALTAGPWMQDALVSSPTPGSVQVAVLTTDGAPSSAQLASVVTILNGDTVRPITDQVSVVAAVRIPFTITASIVLLPSADLTSTLVAVNQAAQDFGASRRYSVGLDATQDQIKAALFVPGVYSVTLTAPASDVLAGSTGFCDCTAVSISYSGTL